MPVVKRGSYRDVIQRRELPFVNKYSRSYTYAVSNSAHETTLRQLLFMAATFTVCIIMQQTALFE